MDMVRVTCFPSQLLHKADGMYKRLVNRQMQGGGDLSAAFNDLTNEAAGKTPAVAGESAV